MSKSDQALEISSNSKTPNPYDIEELYKIIRVQQGTINKLSLEVDIFTDLIISYIFKKLFCL